MNDDRESFLEFFDDSSLGCWAYGKLESYVRDQFPGRAKIWVGAYCVVPTVAELQEIFTYMKQHDIPVVEPKNFVLNIRLMKAGVRIID